MNKAKLMKLCKNKKVSKKSLNGSKQEMVDALIKKNMKNVKKKNKKHNSKQKPKAFAKRKEIQTQNENEPIKLHMNVNYANIEEILDENRSEKSISISIDSILNENTLETFISN
eukprot:107456_1